MIEFIFLIISAFIAKVINILKKIMRFYFE